MKYKTTVCLVAVVSVGFLRLLLSSNTCLASPDPNTQKPQDDPLLTEHLVARIKQITDSLPADLPPDANDAQWRVWESKHLELRDARIKLIDELDKSLPADEVNPYIETRLEDIRRCFFIARQQANYFEGQAGALMEQGNIRAKTLAAELFWSLNVHYVNTHLMTVSATDMQTIADLELSRRDQPEAGRLLLQAIGRGHLSAVDRNTWRSWVLEHLPPESEGYKLLLARERLGEQMGKPFHFKAPDVDGKPIDSNDLKGKIILLDFWALWCGYCLVEQPLIKELHHDYYDRGLRVIGIFNDYRVDDMKSYVRKHAFPWPQLVDPAASSSSFMHPLAREFGFEALPRYLLIDRHGILKNAAGRVESLKSDILGLLADYP